MCLGKNTENGTLNLGNRVYVNSNEETILKIITKKMYLGLFDFFTEKSCFRTFNIIAIPLLPQSPWYGFSVHKDRITQ